MYDLRIETIDIPKGMSMGKFIKDVYLNTDPETSKDVIYRVSYKIAVKYLNTLTNMVSLEEGIGAMNEAFMKTYNNYNPYNEAASFINYYKKAIRDQVILDYMGRYRNHDHLREAFNNFNNSLQYLDEPVEGKDGEAGIKMDIIGDKHTIEEEIMYKFLLKRIYEITDEMFDGGNNGPKKQWYKKLFLIYINGHIQGYKISYQELTDLYGWEYGLEMSAIRSRLTKYKRKLKSRLIEEGYIC